VIAALSVFVSAAAGAQPPADWIRHYDSGNRFTDHVEFMALGPDGSITVTGTSDDENLVEDIATIRYDANGNQQWVARYNGTLDWIDVPAGVGVDAAGNAYVLGTTWGGFNHTGGGEWDYILIKYNPDGTTAWTRQYDGPLHWSETPTGLVVDGAGNSYVCGYAVKERDQFGNIAAHFHVAKFDTLGNLEWEVFYDLDPHRRAGAEDIRIAPDGNIVATGIAAVPSGGTTQDDIITMKVSPAGQVLWVRQWDSGGTNNDQDRALRVRTDRFGNVYALGQIMSDDLLRHLDGVLIRYAPDGTLDWVVNTGLDNPDALFEMVDDEAGNLYLAGGWDNGTDNDGMVVSLDAAGQERWRVFFDDDAGFDYQHANTVMRGPDGLIYVGLDYQWDDAAGYDYTIAVMGTDGSQLDLWRYDAGSGTDTFPWIDGYVMDAAGNIFIGGYSWFDLTRVDFTVVKVPTQSGGGAPGDIDGDGDVDLDDLTLLLQDFGCNTSCTGDLDGDGDTDLDDLTLLLQNFGA
jgi:hypothetical protein